MTALEPVSASQVVYLSAADLDLDDGSSKGPGSSVAYPRIPAGPKNCNGVLHSGKGYCGQPMGYDTPHTGTGRCVLHGGMAPSSMKAAAAFMANQQHTAMGRPMGTSDPLVAMRTNQQVADGMVQELGRLLAELKDPVVVDHLGDQTRSVREVQLAVWLGLSTQVAATMTKLGLEAREVAFHEATVAELVAVVLAIIDNTPAAGLSHDQRQVLRAAAAVRIRALKPAGPTEAGSSEVER